MAKHRGKRLDDGVDVRKRQAVETPSADQRTRVAPTTTSEAAVATTPAQQQQPAPSSSSSSAAVVIQQQQSTTPAAQQQQQPASTVTKTALYTGKATTVYQSVAVTKLATMSGAQNGTNGALTIVVVLSQANNTMALNSTALNSTMTMNATSSMTSMTSSLVPLTEPAPSATISRSNVQNTSSRTLSNGGIAGAVVGSVVGFLLLLLLALFGLKRWRDKKRNDEMDEIMADNASPYGGAEFDSTTGAPEPSARYSYEDVGAPMSEARY